jgi:hypothetical protein
MSGKFRRQIYGDDNWYWSPDPRKKFELPRNSRPNDALASKKYVQTCMRNALEKKTIVVQNLIGNSGVPTTSGRVDPLQTYNIIQGTGDGNRTGNFVKVSRVWLRFNANLPAGVPAALFRVIVFRDRNTNGATPAVSDVIEFGTGGGAAGYNDDNVTLVGGARFTILSDKWFSINASLGSADASSGTHISAWVHQLTSPSVVHFKASAGAIADVVSGETFILTYAGHNSAVVQCQAQIEFIDQ